MVANLSDPRGAPKKGMRDYVIVSDGVNEQTVNVDGDYVHVQSLAVPGNSVLLRFDDGPQIKRYQGQGNRVYYNRVGVVAAAADTVILQLGNGYATDTRSTISVGSITAPIEPALHNVALAAVNITTGAQALLSAADASRAELGISLDAAQANGIFVGDVLTANDVGLFIEPGDKVFIASVGAIYGYNPGAGTIKVRLLNLRNV